MSRFKLGDKGWIQVIEGINDIGLEVEFGKHIALFKTDEILLHIDLKDLSVDFTDGYDCLSNEEQKVAILHLTDACTQVIRHLSNQIEFLKKTKPESAKTPVKKKRRSRYITFNTPQGIERIPRKVFNPDILLADAKRIAKVQGWDRFAFILDGYKLKYIEDLNPKTALVLEMRQAR